MNERIRIDSADVARAPAAESGPQSLGNSMPVSSGDVFGKVSASQATQMGPGSGGIWAKPKFLFAVAGLAAAVVASILVDGIGGFNRAEAAGEEPSPFLAFLFIGSFASLLTACIAAADDVASGAYGRGLLFGLLGFVFGGIGGVLSIFGGGMFALILGPLLLAMGLQKPESDLGLVFTTMLFRAPIWLIMGALSGALIGAMGRAWRRVWLGVLGGAAGGLLGGMFFDPLMYMTGGIQPGHGAWLSRLIGVMAMGSATGFAIAYAEQAAKQAWLAIERGRLIGKQFIIYRNPTRIGASYSNDVFLFKDPSVQQEHARILRRGGSYVVEALSGALLRVNGQPTVSRALSNGDTLQVGETVMRFNTKS